MKAVIAVLVVTYSLFVFIAGDATQKGMLLAVLILLGLILLFYEYAHFARTKISKYEELTRAISVADDLTDLIKQLEDKKALYEGKELLPGLTLGSVIGIIRRSKFKSNIIQSETYTNDRPSQPPQKPTNTPGIGEPSINTGPAAQAEDARTDSLPTGTPYNRSEAE